MATNMIYKNGIMLEMAVPVGTVSGDPVVLGNFTGVALTDRNTAGNASVKTDGVFDLSVKAINDSGDSAVAIGDTIFWLTGDTPKLSKKNSGTAFGVALEIVALGATDTIKVKLMDIAATQAAIITNAMMADDSINSDQYIDGSIDLAHFNANQKVRLIALTIGALSTTTTFCVHAALKACEVKSVTFINANADPIDGTDFWKFEVINKGIDGTGTDVVATQTNETGGAAIEAYIKYPLVVATDGKEDIAADSVLVFTATIAASATALAECVIVLELEVQDPA